jgi:hypothetical protein
MKFLVMVILALTFCVSLKAQDAGNNLKSEKAENGVMILNQGEDDGSAIVFDNAGRKMQSRYEQLKTDVLTAKTYKTENIPNCQYGDDNSCSSNNSGSCTSNMFLWGAVSLLTGIIAIAGFKGK